MNLNECKPNELKTDSTLRSLFARTDAMVEKLAENMVASGFDPAFPIVAWNGVVVDGYTRLAAARKAGVRKVYYVDHQFPDEDAALEYAIHCQRDRRNLTDAELLRCQQELDKRRTRAEAAKHAQEVRDGIVAPCGATTDEPAGKSAAELAKQLGVSTRKAERIRTVNDHAPAEVRAAVEAGEKSINAAYRETVAARGAERESKPNEPQKDLPPADKAERYRQQLMAVATAKPRTEWPAIAATMHAVADWLTENAEKDTP